MQFYYTRIEQQIFTTGRARDAALIEKIPVSFTCTTYLFTCMMYIVINYTLKYNIHMYTLLRIVHSVLYEYFSVFWFTLRVYEYNCTVIYCTYVQQTLCIINQFLGLARRDSVMIHA